MARSEIGGNLKDALGNRCREAERIDDSLAGIEDALGIAVDETAVIFETPKTAYDAMQIMGVVLDRAGRKVRNIAKNLGASRSSIDHTHAPSEEPSPDNSASAGTSPATIGAVANVERSLRQELRNLRDEVEAVVVGIGKDMAAVRQSIDLLHNSCKGATPKTRSKPKAA